MKVAFLSALAVLAACVSADHEVAAVAPSKVRKLNTLRDDSWYTYGDLHHRPVTSYHYRRDRPSNHGSHMDTSPASTGIPATSGCMQARDECWFRGPPRLRGPTYATDNFWNRGNHDLYSTRYHHLNRVALPTMLAEREECYQLPPSRFANAAIYDNRGRDTRPGTLGYGFDFDGCADGCGC